MEPTKDHHRSIQREPIMKKATLTFALMLLATLSFAHANVTSEAVKARMTLMTDFKRSPPYILAGLHALAVGHF